MGAIAANWILSQPWLLREDKLETLLSIAYRTNEAPELVAARLGRPLDNTRSVEVRDNGVAVIPVRGVISRYSSMFSEISGGVSTETLATDFRQALDSPEVRGIVLDFDTPGGQANGIGELAAMIRAGSQVKPVCAYVGSEACSAGLWLASAAGSVVIDPIAIMGSMGAVIGVSRPPVEGESDVIEFVSSVSPNKRPNVMTDAGRSEIQRLVDATAQVFVESVASYRGLKPDDAIERFGRGGMKIGRDAVAAGMADSLGSLESTIESLGKRSAVSANVPISFSKGSPMKLNMTKLFTGWLSKGRPEVLDVGEIADASADDTETEADDVAKWDEELKLTAKTAEFEANIKAAREKLRAEMAADMRVQRIELAGMKADAYLALHADKYAPAERDRLRAGYIGAALMDAETPVDGFSYLDGFTASIEARKPSLATKEVVSGDASVIKDHLDKHSLKLLDSAAPTPEDEKERAANARMLSLLESTEEGRAILAEMKANAK